jgi:hypothetical protein
MGLGAPHRRGAATAQPSNAEYNAWERQRPERLARLANYKAERARERAQRCVADRTEASMYSRSR